MDLLLTTCAATLLLNLTSEGWTPREKQIIARAKHVCSTDKRYTDTPCLKRFVKLQPHNYQAICGE